MFKIYCPIINKNNNNFLKEKLLLYQKENPCCSQFDKCDHPKYQSNSFLHHSFPIFKKSLESVFKSIEIDNMWCFITFPKSEINTNWHNHGNVKDRYSAICYLNNTVGTEFKNVSIDKPDINTWYIWKSDIEHRPIKKSIDNLRINIVGDIYLT